MLRIQSLSSLLEQAAGLTEPEFVKDEGLWDKAKRAAHHAGADNEYSFANWWYHHHEAPKEASAGMQKPSANPAVAGSSRDLVNDLLNKNPGITGATFLNLLKSNGLVINSGTQDTSVTKKKQDSGKKETVSASGAGAQERPGVKESDGNITFRCRFLEGKDTQGSFSDGIGPTRFKVVLIEEGMGNFGDAFYYTRAAIESAVVIFEGKKCYANHPRKSEENDIPERDVRDILGWFENVHVEESEGKTALLCADLVTLPDEPYAWARALVRSCLAYGKKYPDKEFVGLSVNASGNAEEIDLADFMTQDEIPETAKPKLVDAVERGITELNVVREITAAVSCDLVTEAGARGRVLELMEQEKETMAKKKITAKKAKEADDAGHDDADKDKELIMGMLKKYGVVKDGEEADEATMKMAMEAYAAAKEMGMEGEEAEKCAGYAMKTAQHVAKKQAEAKKDGDADAAEEGEEGEEADESEEHGDDDEDDGEPAAPVAKGKKESAGKKPGKEKEMKETGEKVLVLTAEVAALKEENRQHKLEKLLEKTLAESALPRAVTKKFREAIGVLKGETEGSLTAKFKLFKEAYQIGGSADADGFVVGNEKNDGEDSSGDLDFSDCVQAD